MTRRAAWVVLTLVFVDELLAVGVLGYVGSKLGAWSWTLALMGAAIGAWWGFASPKAPWGGPVLRPLTKVLVFGAASAGLWWAGHPALAVALLGFSVVVNGLAQTRGVRQVLAGLERR